MTPVASRWLAYACALLLSSGASATGGALCAARSAFTRQSTRASSAATAPADDAAALVGRLVADAVVMPLAAVQTRACGGGGRLRFVGSGVMGALAAGIPGAVAAAAASSAALCWGRRRSAPALGLRAAAVAAAVAAAAAAAARPQVRMPPCRRCQRWTERWPPPRPCRVRTPRCARRLAAHGAPHEAARCGRPPPRQPRQRAPRRIVTQRASAGSGRERVRARPWTPSATQAAAAARPWTRRSRSARAPAAWSAD
eukprot:349686-Chlamydomonas_euryale.AAC.14